LLGVSLHTSCRTAESAEGADGPGASPLLPLSVPPIKQFHLRLGRAAWRRRHIDRQQGALVTLMEPELALGVIHDRALPANDHQLVLAAQGRLRRGVGKAEREQRAVGEPRLGADEALDRQPILRGNRSRTSRRR